MADRPGPHAVVVGTAVAVPGAAPASKTPPDAACSSSTGRWRGQSAPHQQLADVPPALASRSGGGLQGGPRWRSERRWSRPVGYAKQCPRCEMRLLCAHDAGRRVQELVEGTQREMPRRAVGQLHDDNLSHYRLCEPGRQGASEVVARHYRISAFTAARGCGSNRSALGAFAGPITAFNRTSTQDRRGEGRLDAPGRGSSSQVASQRQQAVTVLDG